jgi:hypothetical protein
MPTEFDLPWILPYVRESLRGRSNFNFDQFVDGLWAVLERAGVGKGIEKPPITQGYTGKRYNYDAAHPDIRNAATEAFYYLEQNRFILRPPPTNATAFLPHGQFTITARGQEWASGAEPLPEDYNGYMSRNYGGWLATNNPGTRLRSDRRASSFGRIDIDMAS